MREKRWAKTDPGLRSHPNFLDLVAELESSPIIVDGLLHGLWAMAFTDAPDGNITRFKPRALARAVGWDIRWKSPDILVTSLIETGFVDRVGNELHIHDWEEWGGALYAERTKDARRKAEAREQAASEPSVPVTSGGHPRTSTGPSRVDREEDREQEQEQKSSCRTAACGTLFDDSEERVLTGELVTTNGNGSGTVSFDDFWAAWPKREGKKDAARHWKAMSAEERRLAHGVACVVAELWARLPHDRRQFVPMGSTFLYQKRWQDFEDGHVPAQYLAPGMMQAADRDDTIARAAARVFGEEEP